MSVASPPIYNARSAWKRALVYFAVCWIAAAFTGLIGEIMSRPLATADQQATPFWWLWTALCTAVILVGYGYIWPKGTLHHGRKLNWSAVLTFGFLWGTSEGLLFIMVWSAIDYLVTISGFWTMWLVGIITFVVLSTYKGVWHANFWDIYVSPEHNIEAWNLRKVLWVHTPNLIVTLIHLNMFTNLGLFVIWQTAALMLSTYFMRISSPFSEMTATETEN